MKKPDLVKQLANRINQPHVIKNWIEKIERSAYKKGYLDAETKQLALHNVSVSFLYDFVNEFTDTEIPKEAIKETLTRLNER